jgi:DNA-directed RNA polymerase specialized sigma subunit
MIPIEREDINQEIALCRLEHKDINVKFVINEMFRNKKYQYSYNDKFEHIHMEDPSFTPEILLFDPKYEDIVEYNNALSLLSKRNSYIVELWSNGYGQAEIGHILDISRSMVCKIIKSSIKKIRKKWGII